MAKGKKGQPTASGTGQAVQAVRSSTDLSLPAKPPRKGNAPGRKVLLISNLFCISLKLEKPIYCHTIQIDSLEDAPVKRAGGDQDATKKPALPRKIPKDMRQQAVKRAVESWLKNNTQKVESCKYVLDSNASTLYSLFKMLDLHDGKPGTRNSLEIKSSAKSKYIENQKVVDKDEAMLVKIFSPSPINVKSLIDHCAGKLPRSSTEVEVTLRTINALMTPRYMEDPRYLCMQHKSGMASVFPYDNRNQFPISKGVICNKGFTTSVRTSEVGLVAVIANTCAPFYQPLSLLKFINERYKVGDFSKPLPSYVISELKKEFKTKQVEATHINYGDAKKPHYRKYRVHDIGGSTKDETFEEKDTATGKTITISVFDYFKKTYPKSPLKYPDLPCIIDNKRKIPLEICQLIDKQKVNRKLEPEETSAVIKQMAVRPERHFDTIRNNAKDVIAHSQPMNDFGLQIEQIPIEVTGRELPPITLLARDGKREAKQVMTKGGGYDVFNSKFASEAVVNKWALVILADSEIMNQYKTASDLQNDCKRFSKIYASAGFAKGVKVGEMAEPTNIINLNLIREDSQLKTNLRKEFEKYNEKGFDHIIFILPKSRDWIYSYLQYLEVDVPMKRKVANRKCTRASCIKTVNFVSKIIKGDPRNASMFLNNLWLKYNTKLGGVNIALKRDQNFGIDVKDRVDFLAPGYLFISIDVCHPAPGDRLEQSVAAAVGMWNLTAPNMSHCTRVRVQRKDKSDKEKSTVEQVGEIGVMFEEILMSYKQKNDGKMPTHIVILRDGVSEGQFQMVLRFELGQIKARLKNFYDNLKLKTPLLTCLTVQKRHKVRFMRKEPVKTNRGDDDYNIQPGTVVDNTVVQPFDFSFYMAPHKAIQGTSRAPHIYMILDEIKFSQDAAQAMIFALSYLSPRCTKGTSIPTPVNLADLAAERGKNIVVSWNDYNQKRKMSLEERLVELNAFLSTMGDSQYQNTLYYV